IRDRNVTGVQTCALPISRDVAHARVRSAEAKAEVANDLVPVPVGLRDAASLQLFQRAHTERADEAGQPRALRIFGGGPPDDLAPAGLGHPLLPRRQCTRTRATGPTRPGLLLPPPTRSPRAPRSMPHTR